MSKGRFRFPGFILRKIDDTPLHEVEVGDIEDGGTVFHVHMIRNARAAREFPHLDFLVAHVYTQEGKPLWDFKSQGFNGVGLLARAGDCAVIALVGHGPQGKVKQVIPLSRLISHVAPEMRRLIRLKREAAAYLKRDHVLAPLEEKLVGVDVARQKAADAAEREAAQTRRVAERQQRVQRIMAREKITAYTAKSAKMTGVPVVESEWPSLPNGTYCILVDSFDEKGKPGKPVEVFKVQRGGGKNPRKEFAVAVFATEAQVVAASPKPVGEVIIEREGGAYPVALYASMDDIRSARAAGLNGGTLVAVQPQDKPQELEIYGVHAEQVQTLGRFSVLA